MARLRMSLPEELRVRSVLSHHPVDEILAVLTGRVGNTTLVKEGRLLLHAEGLHHALHMVLVNAYFSLEGSINSPGC
jgi:hypothetical protein